MTKAGFVDVVPGFSMHPLGVRLVGGFNAEEITVIRNSEQSE